MRGDTTLKKSKKFRGTVSLKRSETLAEGLHTLSLWCLCQVKSSSEDVRRGSDGEALHEMRVGLRRLKAVLAVFRKVIDPQRHRRLRREIRWLLKALGPARDIDVFLSDITSLPTGRRPEVERALAALRGHLTKIKTAEFKRAEEAICSARFSRFTEKIADFQLPQATQEGKGGKEQGSKSAIFPFARHYLEKRLSKILPRLAALNRMNAAEQHKLRIAVKKLRYGVEFFSSLFGKRVKRMRRMLKLLREMQDSLGKLNDIKVHREIMDVLLLGRKGIRDVAEVFAIGFIEGEQQIRGKQFLKSAMRTGKKLSRSRAPWE